MESRAKDLLSRADRMKSDRSIWESHWTEIAETMAPMRNDFITQRQPGEKRMQRIFDGTPGVASANLANGLWGMLTNSALAWFELKLEDENLNEDRAVKVYLDETTRALRAAFASNGQQFYAAAVDLFSDLVHFGTGVFYVDEPDVTRPELFFSCRSLSECYIAENDREKVDTLFRRYRWAARQAAQRWGKKCGAKVLEAAEKRPEQMFEFLHCVLPRTDFDGKNKMPVASAYLCVEDGNIIDEGGYEEFPYQVPRWSQMSRSVYGDSPAMLALPDSRQLQEMSKVTMAAARKMVDPPILTADDSPKMGVRLRTGGLIPGGIDAQGRPRYAPLVSGGQPQLGLEMEDQRRAAIREAFFATLLMMTDQPGRTATEVLQLTEEKVRQMGAHLGRVQSQFLAPLVERVYLLEQRAGRLPPPPDDLVGQAMRVEYVSPVARAQRAGEAVAVLRTFEAVAPFVQADPSIMDNFNGDEIARGVASAFAMPPKMLRPADAVDQMREQRQQQQALLALSEQAPKVAQAEKSMAEAQQIADGNGKGKKAA